MELTKEALDNVRFRTKGLWYDAQQVDTFLEQLTAAVEQEQQLRGEEQAEAAALRSQVEEQLEEIAALKSQLEETRQTAEEAAQAAESAKAALAEETEKALRAQQEADALRTEEQVKERDSLLQDIKALRALRDQFKSAIQQDLAGFTEKLQDLDSDRML